MKHLEEVIRYTRPLTLLYVEDNDEAREMTIMVLEDFFDNIVIARDGEEGLERFRREKIDLVITDINMPKMDGIELCRRIREEDELIPLVVLSAHNEEDFFIESIEIGVSGYLLKPIDIDRLTALLHRLLQSHRFMFESRANLRLMHTYQQAANLSCIVSKTDPEGVITFVNDAFCDISGYTREELIGQTHRLVRHPDTPRGFYEALWSAIKEEKRVWRGTLRNRSRTGRSYYLDALIMPVTDLDGRILEYISLSHDITDIMHPAKQLQNALRHVQNPLLVYMKLADYDIIEEFYDTATFEMIQSGVAEYLQRLFGTLFEFDRVYSLGNGEYAVIFENPDEAASRREMLDLLRTYQIIIRDDTIDLGTFEYDVSLLMSVVTDREKILESARLGIKQMMRDGRRFLIADGLAERVRRKAGENMATLALVKEAVANDRIVSYFQPIVDNATGEVAKYESLVRLIDGDGNTLSPFFFLDIAKKSNLYHRITALVLERSFAALLWTDREISVNLSLKDAEHHPTRTRILRLLERYKAQASRIVFELLEDENVESHETIRDFIASVKQYGVKIAIDDFGSGFSNYRRLLEYEPDLLKIDGSLIRHLIDRPYARSVVKSIVTFAREQGMKTVAEYVEDPALFEAVKALGIDFSQGYLFGRPGPLAEDSQRSLS